MVELRPCRRAGRGENTQPFSATLNGQALKQSVWPLNTWQICFLFSSSSVGLFPGGAAWWSTSSDWPMGDKVSDSSCNMHSFSGTVHPQPQHIFHLAQCSFGKVWIVKSSHETAHRNFFFGKFTRRTRTRLVFFCILSSDCDACALYFLKCVLSIEVG